MTKTRGLEPFVFGKVGKMEVVKAVEVSRYSEKVVKS